MSESGRSSIALTMAGAAIVAAAVIVIARWSPAPAGTHRAGLQGPAPAVLSADAETTLGPGPGESAWIEAEVAGPEAGPWQLLLASVSERDEVLVESEPGARIALIAVRDGKRRTLGTAVLPSRLGAMGPAMPQGRPASIWARRRGEAWSVWIDGELVFAAEARVEGDACLPSGTARVGFRARRRSAGPEGPRLVRMSAMPPTDPAFRDSFMREDPGETWRALAGAWEMAGIRYPERSANPFSLFARFPGMEVADPFLERRYKRPKSGIGVHMTAWRGVAQIERITGNGPAALAGLQEDDIVVAIDGEPTRTQGPFDYYEDLEGPEGSEINLTVLRPGELTTREVKVTRRTYRWAKVAYGTPIAGSSVPGTHAGGADEALAVAGSSWWDGCRFEASVSCPGAGGAGLAFGVRDAENYHLFAMVGDAAGTDIEPGRLALVEVRGGRRTVLASRPWGPRPGTYYRLGVAIRHGPRASDGSAVDASLDGATVLSARTADLPAGMIGLWALRGAGAYFDDVAVSTDHGATGPPEDRRAAAIIQDERDMRKWANPSDEWAPDPGSDWWWNIYRFPGAVTMKVSPQAQYDALSVQLDRRLREGAPPILFGVSRGAGEVRIGEGGFFETASLPEAPGTPGVLEFRRTRDGRHAIVADGRALIEQDLDASDLAAGGVGVRGLTSLSEPGAVEVVSDSVRDYYFRCAPVDWAVEAGRWGITNKWICDPRFSWFGGHSRSLAAIWHKLRAGGDVTLDFYAALVMTGDDPPYERVGDFACAILGDGKSLSSGYALVVSGGRNRWTRLYGGGRLLAESRDAADRMPSNVLRSQPKADLHQRWFRFTLERVAGRVRFLYDGRKVFDVPDALGVDAGHCALWTHDNGMLVARARLAADEIAHFGNEGAPPPWGATLSTQELGGLTNLAFGETGTRLALDGAGPAGEPAARVENARSGGAFAAASVRDCGPEDRLSFDFRAGPGARVDLYLEPSPYRVRLTGPHGQDERHPVLAGPLAQADGKWHRVEIDLGRLLAAYRGTHAGLATEHWKRLTPVFCNLEDGDGDEYLPAGIGGNGPLAHYWVSGFSTAGASEGDAAGPSVRAILLPGEEDTPEGVVRVAFKDDVSGIEPSSIDLRMLPAVTGPANLSAGAQAGDDDPAAGGRVRTDALRFDWLSQELSVDLARAWSGSGAPPDPKEGLVVEVRRYADRAGNPGERAGRIASPGGWKDVTGPALVGIAVLPMIPGEVDLDFEPAPRTFDGIDARVRAGCPVMSLDVETSVGGDASLHLSAAELATDFVFPINDGWSDLDRLLRMSFDYRIHEETTVNLLVFGRQGMHGVVFNDRWDPESYWAWNVSYAGEFEGVRADGLWHRASLPLAEVFRKKHPSARSYPARGVYLADSGWKGLRAGDCYRLDNFRIEGVRSGRELAVRWRAFDLSGVTAAAWTIDSSDDTVPDEPGGSLDGSPEYGTVRPDGAARLPDGPAYFHLRLRDGAGNWSRTWHRRVLIDNTPPRVGRVEPADGTDSPARKVRVRFEDYAGVDPASVRLRAARLDAAAGPVEVVVDGAACRFDRGTGTLTWLPDAAGAEMLAPGARIEVEVLAARDIVGNELKLPFRWSWTSRPELDETPPPAPRMCMTTGRTAQGYLDNPMFTETNDFERWLEPVERISGCKAALSGEAAFYGRAGARITVTGERRGRFVACLRERFWFTDRRPFFTFDYRLPGSIDRLALRVDFLRQTHELTLIGDGASEPLAADGRWHRATIDLGGAAERWGVEFPTVAGAPYRIAQRIYLVGTAAPGAELDLDNVELVDRAWRGATVEWPVPEDESGIRAFAVAWDRDPDTVPPETGAQDVRGWSAGQTYRWRPPPDERSGVWHLHVRAQDGSGNWGQTAHLAVDFDGRQGR